MKEEIATFVGVMLALASAVLSLLKCEGIMLAISVFAVAFGILAVSRCSSDTAMLITSASGLALIATVLSVTVLEPEGFMNGDDPSTSWFVLIGLIHTIPLVLLVFAVLSVMSAMFGASYNWVLVRGLSPFVAMGMEVPGFVLEYIFMGVDTWMTDNGYILYHFLVTGVVVAAMAYMLSVRMRRSGIVMARGRMEAVR